jgi:phage gp29-like protein
MGVSAGRFELTAAKAEAGSLDEALAQTIASTTREIVAAIPSMEERLTELAWATYFGMTGNETHWARDGQGWMVDRLSLLHSRRLSYPRSGSWDLYVWDQGAVSTDFRQSVTNKMFGLRVADAPGKFIIHAPQIRGGYPTRNGLGRQLAYWMALKLVASRGAPTYLERFAKPWPEATFCASPKGETSLATPADIANAEAALQEMGAGGLSSWVHADTITLNLRTPDQGATAKLTFPEWIGVCDGQVSKCVSGGTLGTEVGSTGGNRALGDTQRKSEMKLYEHDAGMLASSLKRDLIDWIVRLNFPDAPRRLYPQLKIHVSDDPDALRIIEKNSKAASAGMPVDADAVAQEAGITLIKPGDTKARRLFPIGPQKDPATFDADLAARAKAIAEEFQTSATAHDNDTEPDATGDDDQAVDAPPPDTDEPADTKPADEE